jgi:hypothetical protein
MNTPSVVPLRGFGIDTSALVGSSWSLGLVRAATDASGASAAVEFDAYAGPAMEKRRVSVDMSVRTRRDTSRAPFFHLGFPKARA